MHILTVVKLALVRDGFQSRLERGAGEKMPRSSSMRTRWHEHPSRRALQRDRETLELKNRLAEKNVKEGIQQVCSSVGSNVLCSLLPLDRGEVPHGAFDVSYLEISAEHDDPGRASVVVRIRYRRIHRPFFGPKRVPWVREQEEDSNNPANSR